MANFDKSKKASMDDMENVAGGTYKESKGDVKELWKRGFFSGSSIENVKNVQDILHRLGYTKCQIHCRCMTTSEGTIDCDVKNVYADKDGNIMSRDKFWEQFEEEFI